MHLKGVEIYGFKSFGERMQANGHGYGFNCDSSKVTNTSNFAVLYTLKNIHIENYLSELDKVTNKHVLKYPLAYTGNIGLVHPFDKCIAFTKDLCDLLQINYVDCICHFPEIKIRNDYARSSDVIELIGDCGGTRGIVPAACSGIAAINKV